MFGNTISYVASYMACKLISMLGEILVNIKFLNIVNLQRKCSVMYLAQN
jgi:hypothetical protein